MFLKKINFSNIFLILLVGLLVRLVFTLFIAKHYYGLDNFFYQGDTGTWALSFHNWYYTGTYTSSPEYEFGGFVRMPGYSFFLGLFYLLCGKDWFFSFKVVGYTQIFIDVFSVYLVYIITKKVFSDIRIAAIAAWLFVFYPFAIVWNPVAYSEILSLNLMLISLWFFINKNSNKSNIFWCAFFIAIGTLVRPQLGILFPVYAMVLATETINWKIKFKQGLIYSITILLVFGVWPARNYFSQGKFILLQDLRGAPNWDGEVLAYTSFIYSAQVDWEPQFSQILNNKNVDFPKYFIGTKEDSVSLQNAFYLAKNRSCSFSQWKGFWQGKYLPPNKNVRDSMIYIFNDLREKQIKNQPFLFYIKLPILNLKKAILKNSLYDTKSSVRRLASFLFYYRTLLILIGIIGTVLILKNKANKNFGRFSLLYFLLLYLALCAGTGAMFRNIEVRYFLHADVVLLIPAAYLIQLVISKFKHKSV